MGLGTFLNGMGMRCFACGEIQNMEEYFLDRYHDWFHQVLCHFMKSLYCNKIDQCGRRHSVHSRLQKIPNKKDVDSCYDFSDITKYIDERGNWLKIGKQNNDKDLLEDSLNELDRLNSEEIASKLPALYANVQR